MHRLAPLALACTAAWIPFAASGQAGDAPPSAPGDLTAVAYGPSAGGIRWNRSTDDRGVVGYELRQDGAVLGTVDALSYVGTGFAPDTRYRFEVSAIDTAGQRSAPSTVELLTPPVRADLGPANPDVRVKVYSGTAGELIWRRPTTPGLIYTVVRDGALVYEGDATSYYDADLSPGRSYAYDVQATDRQGRSSAITRVSLTAGGGGGTGPGDEPSAVAAPAGLRGTAYSTVALELFWERPTGVGPAYEVSRDGAVLGTTDGTSFFDDTVPGPGRYAYEVVAVAAGGARSAASGTDVEVPGTPAAPGGMGPNGPDAPVISPDAYIDVVGYALEIYTGKRLRDDILALPGYPVETLDYVPPASEADGTASASATCENGGSVSLDETVLGSRQTSRTREWAFDGCQRGTAVYDGDFTERDFGNVLLSSTGLETIDGARTTRFAGGLDYKSRSNRDGGPLRNYALSGATWTVEGEAPVALREADFRYTFVLGNLGFELDGGYRVASPFTAGRELSVSTPATLGYGTPGNGESYPSEAERVESVRFSAGTLRIEDANGDSIEVTADAADSATAAVEVVAGGETSSFSVPWTTWADELDFFGDEAGR